MNEDDLLPTASLCGVERGLWAAVEEELALLLNRTGVLVEAWKGLADWEREK